MRLPNYKLRYSILMYLHKGIEVNTTGLAREFRCSNSTIYRTTETVMKDLEHINLI